MRHTLKADVLFLIMVFVHIAAVLGITVLSFLGAKSDLSINQRLILSQLLILVPAAIYLFMTKTNPFKLIRFKKIDMPTVFMAVLFTFLMMPLVAFINAISMLFSQNTVLTLTQEMSSNHFLVNLILMAVLPAISEELVFRGVLFHTYRKESVLYGIVISGLVFGFMHLNFNQFSYAFILGVVFALLIEATGSIFTTIIAHFVINGYSVVMTEISEKMAGALSQNAEQLQNELTTEMLIMVAGLYGIIAIGTTSVAIAIYIWIVKHCKRENHMKAVFWIRKGEDKFSIKRAISIPLIISVVICLSYMFYVEIASNNQRIENTKEYNIEEPAFDNTLQIEL